MNANKGNQSTSHRQRESTTTVKFSCGNVPGKKANESHAATIEDDPSYVIFSCRRLAHGKKIGQVIRTLLTTNCDGYMKNE